MNYNDALTRVSERLLLPQEVIDKVYKTYWLFVRRTIEELPLRDNLSEEDFSKLRTNINIPSLGKFHCSYERYLNMKKRYNIIQKLRSYGYQEN